MKTVSQRELACGFESHLLLFLTQTRRNLMTTEEALWAIQDEGLGYFVENYASASTISSIEDEKLRDALLEAKEALAKARKEYNRALKEFDEQ